jgi:hypothetical protein
MTTIPQMSCSRGLVAFGKHPVSQVLFGKNCVRPSLGATLALSGFLALPPPILAFTKKYFDGVLRGPRIAFPQRHLRLAGANCL